MANSFLIFGLGNPGKQYFYSRHNIGRQIVDFLSQNHNCSFQTSKRLKALLCKIQLEQKTIILAKSTLFMNESGLSLKLIQQYYHLPLSYLWVIQDDVDIPFGKIKVSYGRGAAGHHGVESIIRHLKTNKFFRLRIGIWNLAPQLKNKNLTPNYVMANFTPEEQESLEEIKKKAASRLETELISFANPTYER